MQAVTVRPKILENLFVIGFWEGVCITKLRSKMGAGAERKQEQNRTKCTGFTRVGIFEY